MVCYEDSIHVLNATISQLPDPECLKFKNCVQYQKNKIKIEQSIKIYDIVI